MYILNIRKLLPAVVFAHCFYSAKAQWCQLQTGKNFECNDMKGMKEERKRVTIVNFTVNEISSNSAGSSLINSRLITNTSYRSQILRKQDLKTADKLCAVKMKFLSKITPRLRVESTGENMILYKVTEW